MPPSITEDCHPDINILCLPWADPGLCLSVTGHWGLQSHLLPSLLLNLGETGSALKASFMLSGASYHTVPESTLIEEAPTTLMNTGGRGREGEGGGQGKKEGRKI